MGTWSVKINDNDAFQDVYQSFFSLYNEGKDPVDISKKIQTDFAEAFSDHDEKNNSLLGLALAQWETKSLDPAIFRQVKEIIETGNDLEVWRGLGADEKTLQKRKKELAKLLVQLSVEKEKPKRRIRSKFDYSHVNLLTLPAPDGKKVFTISEGYINGEYQHTSSTISWSDGGGAVFYFYVKEKFVTAKWLNSQTLEIRHDKTIQFAKKEETFYYCGDEGVINYMAE